jgi:hypothetical protein
VLCRFTGAPFMTIHRWCLAAVLHLAGWLDDENQSLGGNSTIILSLVHRVLSATSSLYDLLLMSSNHHCVLAGRTLSLSHRFVAQCTNWQFPDNPKQVCTAAPYQPELPQCRCRQAFNRGGGRIETTLLIQAWREACWR